MFFFPLENGFQKLGLGVCFAISPVQSNPPIMSNGVLGKHSIKLCVSRSQHQILPGDRNLHLIIMSSRIAQHKCKAMQGMHISEFCRAPAQEHVVPTVTCLKGVMSTCKKKNMTRAIMNGDPTLK